jgi:hypothetical protein
MENRMTVKRTVVGLLCLIVPALICLNIYQYGKISKITRAIADIKPSGDGAALHKTTEITASISTGRDKLPAVPVDGQSVNMDAEGLRDQLAAAKEELTTAQRQWAEYEARDAEEKKASEELEKRSREAQKKSMQDPSYRKEAKNSLASQYGDLFKKLNLSPENLDKLKDLMVDESMASQELYMTIQTDGNTTLSEKQLEELERRSQAVYDEYESKRKELLGDEGYEDFKEYQASMFERFQINTFMQSLGSGEGLTDDQKEDLIDAVYEAEKNFRFVASDEEAREASDPLSEKGLSLMLRQIDEKNDVYLSAAKEILSASQLEQYRKYLLNSRDISEASFKLQVRNKALKADENQADKGTE